MQLHQLKPKHKLKKKKRVGRGGKRGTYSGRGIKGQKSRAGARIRPAWRDLLKQAPKQKGVKFKSIKEKPQVINLTDLEKYFKTNDLVSPKTLLDKGLVRRQKGCLPKVKILGQGKLTKKLKFQDCLFSKTAQNALKTLSL